jgi:phosphoadenosine phosphosulfate reductase
MQQLDLNGKTKEKLSIEFLREHEPKGEGYYLGFSGGKDSIVLYDLAVHSGVKFQAYYAVTGIDPPELTRFIRANYKNVVFVKPKMKFFKGIVEKCPPTKKIRWCCDKLKHVPLKTVPLRHRLMGVRAEESSGRRKRGALSRQGGQSLYAPIIDWLEWEIWDYIKSNKLSYCRLYDEGFSRLGCVICPFLTGRKKILELHQKRWPRHYEKFEKAMRAFWDKKILEGKTMREDNFEAFLDSWYRGI